MLTPEIKDNNDTNSRINLPAEEISFPQSVSNLVTKKILLAAAAETMASLGYSLLAHPFLSKKTPWVFHPLVVSLCLTNMNFFIRIMHEHLQARPTTMIVKFMRAYLKFFTDNIFVGVDFVTRGILFHEVGHALGYYLLYQNAHPQIELLSPIGAGAQAFCKDCTHLTELGKWFGEKHARTMVAAGGPIASLLESYAMMIVEAIIPAEYSKIKGFLRAIVITKVLSLMEYALSDTIFPAEQWNKGDFTKIAEDGFPISASIFAILGSILLLQFIVCLYC